MPRKKQRPANDPADPRVPGDLWRLSGNRTPAPTTSQYTAIKSGNPEPYQAANLDELVALHKLTKAPFENFSLNPLSTRSIDSYWRSALAKASHDAEAQRPEEDELMRLGRQTASLKTRHRALRAEMKAQEKPAIVPAVAVAVDDSGCSSCGEQGEPTQAPVAAAAEGGAGKLEISAEATAEMSPVASDALGVHRLD